MIKINDKEYKYFLEREHIGLFTKILGKLEIENAFNEKSTVNELFVVIKMIKSALLNLDNSLQESLTFLAAIYNVPEDEIKKMGLLKELKLWKHLFEDEELIDFFSSVFKAKIGLKT